MACGSVAPCRADGEEIRDERRGSIPKPPPQLVEKLRHEGRVFLRQEAPVVPGDHFQGGLNPTNTRRTAGRRAASIYAPARGRPNRCARPPVAVRVRAVLLRAATTCPARWLKREATTGEKQGKVSTAIQGADLAAAGELLVDRIHRQDIVRPAGGRPVLPHLRSSDASTFCCAAHFFSLSILSFMI